MGCDPVNARCLAVLALVSLASQVSACATRSADAQDREPAGAEPADSDMPVVLDLPEYVRALPDLAEVVDAAARETSDVRIQSWAFGDPSEGTYVLVSRARTSAAADTFETTLRSALMDADASVEPATESTPGSRTRIQVGEMVGQVRILTVAPVAEDAEPDLVAVVCFHDQRRVSSLDAPCDRWLSTLESRP